MKRFLAAFAAVLMAVSLIACGSEKEKSAQPQTEAAAEPAESVSDEPAPVEVEELPVIEPEEVSEPTPEPTPEVTEEPSPEPTPEVTPEPTPEPVPEQPMKHAEYPNGAAVSLDPNWEFAGFTVINSGSAVMYRASENRRNIIVGVNAGHGTQGGSSQFVFCHPDQTPKVTGGTTSAGSVQAKAASTGMTFLDGTEESTVNLQEARILRDVLLAAGYDVLMIRDGDDVQLDNVARTVICNNVADCHIAIHWDGDGLDYDKGCFYMAVPDGIKGMYPVSEIWPEDDRLGACLIEGLRACGAPIFDSGSMQMDLTQTSFSKIPSVDIELGNAASDHSEAALVLRAQGIAEGLNRFFG